MINIKYQRLLMTFLRKSLMLISMIGLTLTTFLPLSVATAQEETHPLIIAFKGKYEELVDKDYMNYYESALRLMSHSYVAERLLENLSEEELTLLANLRADIRSLNDSKENERQELLGKMGKADEYPETVNHYWDKQLAAYAALEEEQAELAEKMLMVANATGYDPHVYEFALGEDPDFVVIPLGFPIMGDNDNRFNVDAATQTVQRLGLIAGDYSQLPAVYDFEGIYGVKP